MKKLTLLLLVMLWCSQTFSQVKKQSIGFEFSPTLRSLRGMIGDYYKSDLGFSAGLTYQYAIKNCFSLKSGIIYDKKGASLKMDLYDDENHYVGKVSNKANYNYVVIPLLASLSDKKNHFSISSGPYLGYLISLIEKNDAEDISGKGKKNLTKGSERLDFGWIFGIGYDFAINEKIGMSLVVRDDLGINNLSKDPLTLRTNSLGLRVGLKYNLN
jgi:hypothetical protein